MMKFALSLLLCLILSAGSASSSPPTPTNPTPVTPGGSCDYTAIKDSLYGTESASSGGYVAICRTSSGAECRGGARGRYQFIRDTRSSYIRTYPECNGAACDSDEAWISEACWPVQECIMDRYLAESQDRIRNSPACQELLNSGRTFSGSGQGQTLSCQATESGIMGAMHLGGNGSDSVCRRILSGGGPSDEFDTSVTYYMCKHGGLPVPNNCTPAPYDPSTTQPVATQTQIDTWTENGDTVVIGSSDGLIENWVASLMLMAKQLTANMAYQVQMIGELLDAKHQLETQRLFQEKLSEAHKTYQPSEQMCTFGTFARDLMATSRNADLAKTSISHQLFQREIGAGDSKGVTGTSDSLTRISQFRKYFCDPADSGNGLHLLCPTAAPVETQNADIDFTKTIDQPLSLEIDPTDTSITPDETAVFALVDNLFAHTPLPRIPASSLEQRKFQYHYANLRSLIAMRGIARNSIANIIALKTASPNEESTGASSAPYLRALFREFGLPDDEIRELLGQHPSYNAQMEVLTKKIYQSPTFYTNLYDKPANVKRIRAAMRAIKLMQDRDIQASLHRREMLLSMMLEIRLREQAENVYSAAEGAMFESR